jgi:hypothetical protein
MPLSRICSNCGYDLTGLPSDRCPECGGEIASVAISLSPRALRWSRLKRLWLGIPAGVFTVFVIVWCFLYETAIGHGWWHGFPNVSSFIGSAVGVLLAALVSHTIAWGILAHTSPPDRGRLWWLSMPSTHVVGLCWPIVVLASDSFTVDLMPMTQPLIALLISFVAPLIWRLAWQGAALVTEIDVKPTRGQWIAATVLGVASSGLGMFVVGASIGAQI